MRKETLDLLVDSRQLLAQKGIARNQYRSNKGAVCSLGALIYSDTGQYGYPRTHGIAVSRAYDEAVDHLAQFMPHSIWEDVAMEVAVDTSAGPVVLVDHPREPQEIRITRFNDAATDEKILAIWDEAIQAAELEIAVAQLGNDIQNMTEALA